jgi:hypothetical protein
VPLLGFVVLYVTVDPIFETVAVVDHPVAGLLTIAGSVTLLISASFVHEV